MIKNILLAAVAALVLAWAVDKVTGNSIQYPCVSNFCQTYSPGHYFNSRFLALSCGECQKTTDLLVFAPDFTW